MIHLKTLILVSSFIGSFSLQLSAQREENLTAIGADYINSKFSFSPVEGLFPENATFRYQYRIQTRYVYAPEIQPILNANYYHFPAKYKDNEQADYTFEIVYQLKNFMSDKDAVSDMPSSASMGAPRIKIYKRHYKVFYNGTFNIYKKNGTEHKLYRQIIINDGTQPENILLEKGLITKQYDSYFTSSQEIDYLSEGEVGRVFEAQTLGRCKLKVNHILDALYRPITYKESGILGNIKKKKRNFDFADFDLAYENYKLAMKSYIKDQNTQGDDLINTTTQSFENMLKSTEPRIDKNVKMILQMNLAWCYYWKKEYSMAYQLLTELEPYQTAWNYGEEAIRNLRARLGEVNLRAKLLTAMNPNLSSISY